MVVVVDFKPNMDNGFYRCPFSHGFYFFKNSKQIVNELSAQNKRRDYVRNDIQTTETI